MSMQNQMPHAHFKQVQEFKTDYSPTTVRQYESIRTGLRVVVADQEGPKVNGFFTLATEIHDDSGAPHTLEHLCFMGSRSFRYKGVLDKLATRAYSDTNAWTVSDIAVTASQGPSVLAFPLSKVANMLIFANF